MLSKTLSHQEAQERDAQIGQLSDCKVLTEEEVVQLASKCKELLQQESNVTHVAAPVVVVGDTHGQVRGFRFPAQRSAAWRVPWGSHVDHFATPLAVP